MTDTKKENEYQAYIMKKLRKTYGDDYVIKIPGYVLQGIADIEVTHGAKYARLEAKAYKDAAHRPNQEYRINEINKQGGFARFIYPENEKEVLKELNDFFNN